MIDRWHAAGFLLQHWLKQESAHSIHSPGLFRFYTEGIYPKNGDEPDRAIELLRRHLITGDITHVPHALTPVSPSPVGPAASIKPEGRLLSTVAARECAGPETACLLQRIAKFLGAKRILEIGTSAGLTTLYLSADSEATVLTLEGHPVLAGIARGHFQQFNRRNVHVLEGDADRTLPEMLAGGFRPDLAFIDANHRFEPTCRYVRKVLEHMPEGGIVVLHDINHSPEMSRAWLEVSGYPEVTSAINLGHTGILLTDKRLPVERMYW